MTQDYTNMAAGRRFLCGVSDVWGGACASWFSRKQKNTLHSIRLRQSTRRLQTSLRKRYIKAGHTFYVA